MDIVYNAVQAAYFGTSGNELAKDMGVKMGSAFLYGVFAITDNEGNPTRRSALCVFPIDDVNIKIEEGVNACCSNGPERLSRGLRHFQPFEMCPHEVSLYSSLKL